MAAISALLMATAKVFPEADIFVGPNPYAETIEFIDSYAKHLRRVDLGRSLNAVTPSPKLRSRILLIDSCTPAFAFDATLENTRGVEGTAIVP
jgi:hypothetical protein